LLLSGFSPLAIAIDKTPDAQWDRNDAMAAVRSVNIDVAAREIGDISSLADAETSLANLRNMELRSDWPLPAREAAIHRFTQSLAELPRDAVAVEVMQYLQNFQPRTLVPHEEHEDAYIPLFNIRGAAAGVENGWQRLESTAEAIAMLEQDPAGLVSAYVRSSSHNQRSGYLDALQYAYMADVMVVQDTALQHFKDAPELTALVARTATITADTVAIEQLLINGNGAGLSGALKQLEKKLARSETAALLAFAIQQAPATNAALAIAAWSPQLVHRPETRDLLVDLLADPELGSNAALALAQQPDIQTIKILQDIASGDSIAARRAQMALDLNREQMIRGNQP
jgi:hypothetical protein